MRTFLEVCADIAQAKALYDGGGDDSPEQDYAVQQMIDLVAPIPQFGLTHLRDFG
jgi:hypothetical protein